MAPNVQQSGTHLPVYIYIYIILFKLYICLYFCQRALKILGKNWILYLDS